MAKVDEFLAMDFNQADHTFEGTWLRDLQREVKKMSSDSWWYPIIVRKLQDCHNAQAALWTELDTLFQQWYQHKVALTNKTGTRENAQSECLDRDEEVPFKKKIVKPSKRHLPPKP